MNIEDQVLTIEQVQELQELGFDISKYSSMCWISGRLFVKNDETTRALCLTEKYIPTLTIGDIIEVLPMSIYYLEEYETRLTIKKTYYGYTINYDNIFSSLRETVGIPFSTYKNNYIDALFDCLIWCIKRKYINLK